MLKSDERDDASTETTKFSEAVMMATALVASLFSYVLLAEAFLDLSTLG